MKRRIVLFLLGLLVANLPIAGQEPVEVLETLEVPEELAYASNLRWAGPGSFLIPSSKSWLAVVERASSEPGLRIVHRISAHGLDHVRGVVASEEYWAVSDFNHGLSWKTVDDPEFAEFHHYGFVMDLDLRRDSVLILGAHLDDQYRLISDGALAWTARLGKGLEALRPVLFSQSPDAEIEDAMGECGWFDLGGVRFLADGSFVVVPGVEPNVFLYHPDGRLRRVLDSDKLGIDTGCRYEGADRKRMAINFGYRCRAFLNKYRLLEEILPLAGGPALIVRTVSDETTRWRMILIGTDGSTRSLDLPFTSPSPYTFLRGDVRDDRIAFLVQDGVVGGKQATPTRIVITTTPDPESP